MSNRLGKWLRTWARQFLQIPHVAEGQLAEPETPQAMRIGRSVFNAMLAKTGEPYHVMPRKLEMPKLPDGVTRFTYSVDDDPGMLGEPLAMDDALQGSAWGYLSQAGCGMGFPGYGYLSELSQRSEYRAPSETVASESTREWIDITTNGKASKKKRKARGEDVEGANDAAGGELDDKVEQIEARLKELRIRDLFHKLSEVDGFFGRAQLFIDMDGGSKQSDELNQLPLKVTPETVKKGSLRGFKVIEPIWTSPYRYNATDPTRDDFYKPTSWFVMGKRIHATRLLTFVSREVADILKPAYNFGGLSMSQLMEPYVFQWLRTRNSVSDLIHNFSVMCLKTDMSAVLQSGGPNGDPEAGQGLLERAQLFVQTRDNQGVTLLDMNREELAAVNVPLSTLDKLQAQSQEHMSAPSHIPLVKSIGITPSGLNASSEGEIKVWYDWVGAYQIFFFGPHLKTVIDLIQLDLFGLIDDAISFNFVPLNSPTVKELAEIRKANSETDNNYVNMGAVSSDEVRERVGSDPESGYNNLSGPAPGPPEVDLMSQQHELGQEGADADHERGEESAEAAHARALEMAEKEVSAANDEWREGDHPRADNGEFTSGGGGETLTASSVQEEKKMSPEMISRARNDLNFRKTKIGEQTTFSVHYADHNGDPIKGTAARERVVLDVADNGVWRLSYSLDGIADQKLIGRAESLPAAKLEALKAFPNFAKSLYVNSLNGKKRKALSFGASEGGVIGKFSDF